MICRNPRVDLPASVRFSPSESKIAMTLLLENLALITAKVKDQESTEPQAAPQLPG
jgi:hypothetical protein